jgi:hypothetical protein
MVLPLPVRRGAGDDAVTFVDLSGYPDFFRDLGRAFPESFAFGLALQSRGAPAPAARPLPVVDVGDFEASFVPTPRDFDRLDPRFRLPPSFFDALPAYADFGFAVFRLRPRKKGLFGGAKRQSVHPMALAFPRRDARATFFPTVHVHDGSVPAEAQFDHTLFVQPSPLVAALLGWTPSTGPVESFVDVAKSHGLVAAGAPAFSLPLFGPLPNADLVLREPEGITLDDVEGRGEHHRYRVRGTFAFTPSSPHDMASAWRATAQTKLAPLARGLREGLREFERTNRDRYRLAPWDDSLAPHFLNGRQLWSGTTYVDGRPHAGGGRGRVRFTPFTKRVELQSIDLAFEELPDDRATEAILRSLESLLDRAIAS